MFTRRPISGLALRELDPRPFKVTPLSRVLGWLMAVDVVVGVVNDEVSDDLVRIVWEVAQRIFRKYGLEVYVVPVAVNSAFPYISVNGVRVVVKSPPSATELEDLILSVAMYSEGADESDADFLASLEDPLIADAAFAYY